MTKSVYLFEEGTKEMKTLLGGKGANLAEMTKLGLSVPHGFTITTEACITYLHHKTLTSTMKQEILSYLRILERQTGKKMNSLNHPLLVSVRSGAVFSMPGMMDTILNLGLNDKTVEALAQITQNERFAYDCYRRLLQMFGEVVFHIDHNLFENQLTLIKEKKQYAADTDLSAEDLKEIVAIFKSIYQEMLNHPFPQEPEEQLFLAIEDVFQSWDNSRANVYRELHSISHTLGTAVNIQQMVFGNSGTESGTGVAFIRDPVTGEKKLFGEFLLNAQGEDVVAGIRTPTPISELAKKMPKSFDQLLAIAQKLEQHYGDMQDIEFTIENNQLYLLQTRNGKRTAQAGLQIAVDLVKENIITKKQAIKKIEPAMISQVLHPIFEPKELAKQTEIAKGLPASPGGCVRESLF